MTATEMLERIEKLPSEWRHPDPLGGDASHVVDLHLRHIAEKLAGYEIGIWPAEGSGWLIDDIENHETAPLRFPTYALALLSAAEAVVKEGGANAT